MAQKRRRKHRGTQAGTVEARGRTSRPQASAKAAAPKTARERREARMNQPPSWRATVTRALIGAVLIGVVGAVSTKHNKAAVGVVFAIVGFLLYVPSMYYFDRYMYRRRQRGQADRSR
jgi:Flp pilus assembly protein TadB